MEQGQYQSRIWRTSYRWGVWEKTTHPEHPSQLRVEDSWQLGKQCYQTLQVPNHCFCQLLPQTPLGFHLLSGDKKIWRNKQSSLLSTTWFCGNVVSESTVLFAFIFSIPLYSTRILCLTYSFTEVSSKSCSLKSQLLFTTAAVRISYSAPEGKSQYQRNRCCLAL